MPPMSLPHLMQGITLEQAFRDSVSELLALEARASEVGNGPRVAALDDFIMSELAWASIQDAQVTTDSGLQAEAEDMFRAFVRQGQ